MIQVQVEVPMVVEMEEEGQEAEHWHLHIWQHLVVEELKKKVVQMVQMGTDEDLDQAQPQVVRYIFNIIFN